jgi:hypothetical protein
LLSAFDYAFLSKNRTRLILRYPCEFGYSLDLRHNLFLSEILLQPLFKASCGPYSDSGLVFFISHRIARRHSSNETAGNTGQFLCLITVRRIATLSKFDP